MPYPPGSEVVVRTLGNKRGLVVACGRDGRCQVRVERVTVWCRQDDLLAPPAGERRRRRSPAAGAGADRAEPGATARIDLHGLRVDEAMDRVIDAIDRTLQQGAGRLEVVHGKGAGRIRNALHHALRGLSVVASFRLDPQNPGVTWVYFR